MNPAGGEAGKVLGLPWLDEPAALAQLLRDPPADQLRAAHRTCVLVHDRMVRLSEGLKAAFGVEFRSTGLFLTGGGGLFSLSAAVHCDGLSLNLELHGYGDDATGITPAPPWEVWSWIDVECERRSVNCIHTVYSRARRLDDPREAVAELDRSETALAGHALALDHDLVAGAITASLPHEGQPNLVIGIVE